MRFLRFLDFLGVLSLEAASSNALNSDEMFKNFTDFAVMNNTQFTYKRHAVAEMAGDFDHFHEVLLGSGIFLIGISKILTGQIISLQNHVLPDGVAGKLFGSVFVLIINQTADLIDRVIK